MKVLSIGGDKSFEPGNPRFELQQSAVEKLVVVYWGPPRLGVFGEAGRESAGWRIWPKIPEGKFDVVTVQDPFCRGLFAWYVARRIGAKFNVQVHVDLQGASGARKKSVGLGLAARSADFVGHRERVARFVLRRADSIRVVSKKIKEQVERMGVHAPITVLPIFVDISKYENIVRQPERMVLWVGRFEEEKDPELAIDIVAKIPNARLVMLGRGSLEDGLKRKARGLPVEFPGWRDPKEFFPRASLVLSTSHFEGWGASIVEALASGVPVVAPDVGIAREAGAIVVPREELGRAVLEVLESGATGKLKLSILSREEWLKEWKKSLS